MLDNEGRLANQPPCNPKLVAAPESSSDNQEITPESVLRLTCPTPGYLCPLDANVYGLEFLHFKINDCDSGKAIFEVIKSSIFANATQPAAATPPPSPTQARPPVCRCPATPTQPSPRTCHPRWSTWWAAGCLRRSSSFVC
jgi:hypothetical protein